MKTYSTATKATSIHISKTNNSHNSTLIKNVVKVLLACIKTQHQPKISKHLNCNIIDNRLHNKSAKLQMLVSLINELLYRY